MTDFKERNFVAETKMEPWSGPGNQHSEPTETTTNTVTPLLELFLPS